MHVPVPSDMVVGSITSTVTGRFRGAYSGSRLCPTGSTAEIFTYETTTTDENGFETPSTAFEMRCVDADGNIVKDLGPTYAFHLDRYPGRDWVDPVCHSGFPAGRTCRGVDCQGIPKETE